MPVGRDRSLAVPWISKVLFLEASLLRASGNSSMDGCIDGYICCDFFPL